MPPAIGLKAIAFYQKRISPHKGFRCAHAALHGGLSCSEFGRQVLQRYGYARFAVLMSHRFVNCHQASAKFSALSVEERPWEKRDRCLDGIAAPLEVACCLLSLLG